MYITSQGFSIGLRTWEAKYEYDTGTNGKGRLASSGTGYYSGSTWVIRSRSEYNYRDVMGRPQQLTQWIDHAFGLYYYQIGYQYNLGGGVTYMDNSYGFSMNYTYDSAGRVSSAYGDLADESRTYADSIQYTPWGTVQQERFGTDTPLYNKQRFNSRGQLWDMRLSTVSFASDPANGDRGSIVNYYSNTFTQGGSGTDNNGNLLRQDINIPGANYFRQSYSYDPLNRLASVTEKLNGTGGDSFNQTFTYDRYGNRTINAAATFNAPEPQFDTSQLVSSNRLYAPGENLGLPCDNPATTARTMCYDASGNLKRDKQASNAGWMIYNAENKLFRHNTGNTTTNPVTFYYDAEGKRTGYYYVYNASTRYVYGLDGEVLFEISDSGATKQYGYVNGKLLIVASGVPGNQIDVRWLVTDHLGTPRIVVDKTGSLSAIRRHDYLPFGEEIGSTTGGRSTAQGYASPQSDGVRQQFTSYERDAETGLDYAQARYFGSSLGRFTSVDPLAASASLGDPQLSTDIVMYETHLW